MAYIEISDELWDRLNTYQERFNFPTQTDFLEFCLDITTTRYWPAATAIVTRDDGEILMVGNDYGEDELVWNLPGGAVDPGEDLIQAVTRELHEETGITALEIGPLAWVLQAVLEGNRPFIIAFAFEVTAWEGQVSLDNEVEHGDVQQARFVPFAEALACIYPRFQTTLRDWLSDPGEIPRIYQSNPEGIHRVK